GRSRGEKPLYCSTPTASPVKPPLGTSSGGFSNSGPEAGGAGLKKSSLFLKRVKRGKRFSPCAATSSAQPLPSAKRLKRVWSHIVPRVLPFSRRRLPLRRRPQPLIPRCPRLFQRRKLPGPLALNAPIGLAITIVAF